MTSYYLFKAGADDITHLTSERFNEVGDIYSLVMSGSETSAWKPLLNINKNNADNKHHKSKT